MAHGYFQSLGGTRLKVYSAGVETHGLNPRAVLVMKEDNVDISSNTSNHVDEYSDIAFDLILTVCDSAKERCPVFPSESQKVHFSFSDPAGATGSEEDILHSFRMVRNEIKSYVKEFIDINL